METLLALVAHNTFRHGCEVQFNTDRICTCNF